MNNSNTRNRKNNVEDIFTNIIYALCDPLNNNRPFYIGKSKHGLNRPFEHIEDKSHSDIVNEWIDNLKRNGQVPLIIVLEYTTQESLLNDKEKFWIEKYIEYGYPLLNKTLITPKEKNNTEIIPQSLTKEIAQFIRTNRLYRNITQEDFAKKCNLPRKQISRIESGNSNINFGINTISHILNNLGAKISIISINSGIKNQNLVSE